MNYYQHHIGDYLTATAHLTLIEHGAYRRMLDVYYSTERPLPIDRAALYRLLMVRSKDERAAVDTVLAEFFSDSQDGWHQRRCDVEIGLCNKNRGNGKKGGRPPKNRNPDVTQTEPRDNPDVTQTEPNTKAPTTQYPIPNTPIAPDGADGPPGFAEFWQSYPRKVGKGAAEKAWERAKVNGHQPEVMRALEAQKRCQDWEREGGRFVPNPATWINQRRWEDGEPSAVEAKRDWI